MRITPMMHTVSWTLRGEFDRMVFISDDDAGGMSVTNAAELVCEQCFARFGDKRIVYQDSIGDWAELVHQRGVFQQFAPYGKFGG